MPQFDILSFFNQLTWLDLVTTIGYITTVLYLIPILGSILKLELKSKTAKAVLSRFHFKVGSATNFFNNLLKSLFSNNFPVYLIKTAPKISYLALTTGDFIKGVIQDKIKKVL